MKTGYTPEQGRGFVRPGETEKQQNRGFSDIKKAAPIRSRLSEQFTCCAKNKFEQGNYISQVTKRHNCRITGKEKATCHGGQCDQCAGLLVGYSCSLALRRWRRLISSRIFLGKKPAGLFSGRESLLSVCFSVIHQPLGSMPRRFSSARPNSLSQLARLTPSLLASLSNCSFSSGAIRIWNGGAFPVPFGFLSRLITVDMCTPIALCFCLIGVHPITKAVKKTTPRSAVTHAGRLTKPLTGVTIMAGTQHTPRLAHTQTAFVWRFLALSAGESQIIHVTAWTEREARNRCPSGCVAVFAARIRQGVYHD